jgi:hypothetical protein
MARTKPVRKPLTEAEIELRAELMLYAREQRRIRHVEFVEDKYYSHQEIIYREYGRVMPKVGTFFGLCFAIATFLLGCPILITISFVVVIVGFLLISWLWN